MEKQYIEETITLLNLDEVFNRPIEETLSYIQNLKETCPQKYSNIRIKFQQYYEEITSDLVGDRLETDVEYAARILKEKRDKKKTKESLKLKLEWIKQELKNLEEQEL